MSQQYPAQTFPPPPPPNRLIIPKWVSLTVGAVLIALLAVGVIADHNRKSNAAKGNSEDAVTHVETAKANLEYEVTKVETAETVGKGLLTREPQGQFVLVHVDIVNTGTKPHRFSSSYQRLYDTAGREFGADSAAELVVNEQLIVRADINPGNTLRAALVFDIPDGADPDYVEFHEFGDSPGVRVNVA